MFFVTYEGLKNTLTTVLPDPQHAPMVHMMSASGGEIVSHFSNTPFTFLSLYEDAPCMRRSVATNWAL